MRLLAVVVLLVLLSPLADAKLAPANYPAPTKRDDVEFLVTTGAGAAATNLTTRGEFYSQTGAAVPTPDDVAVWVYTTTDANGSTVDEQQVRATDGALLRDTQDYYPNGSNQPTYHSSQVYDAPCVQYQWPLVVGAKWTSVCQSTSNGTGSPPQQVTETTAYEVTGEERITVPAGTFDTFVVQVTPKGSPGFTEWYSPTVCHHAKVVSKDPAFPSTTVVTEYGCDKAPADPNAPPDASPSPASTPAATSPPAASTPASEGAPATAPTANANASVNARHSNEPAPGVAWTLGAALVALALARWSKRS